MTSLHLVDDSLLGFLETMPGFDFKVEELPAIRTAMLETVLERVNALPRHPDVEYGERRIPGPQGAPEVRVLTFIPKDGKKGRPAYLHVHGGGYVLGSPEISVPKCAAIASTLGAVVVSTSYRLAPETVFPGAVEDCYAALKWLHANADSLGVDKNRIAIGGESAGGGLAAGLGLLARDRGEVPLIHQQLIYPMIDDRTADDHPYVGEFVWTPRNNAFGWNAILGKPPGSKDVSPYAAAARAESLKGLPPTFISTGALDLFLEEDMEYARRLIREGISVEFHIYPGAYHGYEGADESPIALASARDQMNALGAAFARSAKK